LNIIIPKNNDEKITNRICSKIPPNHLDDLDNWLQIDHDDV